MTEGNPMPTIRPIHTLLDALNRCLLRLVVSLVSLIQRMPIAQGVIVFMAGSLSLGTLAYSNIAIIAMVTRGISFLLVLGVGSLTLWLLHYDRRRSRNIVEVGVVMLMITNFAYLFKVDLMVFGLFQDITAIILSLALFFSVAHNAYQRHPELRPLEDRRGRRPGESI